MREHKRALAPSIEAAAEALVGVFFAGALRGVFAPDVTWKEASRLIRRDPRLGPQFGLCLNFYMTKLEQDRGSRNASYKSMVNASSSNMLSLKALDAFFRAERGALGAAAAAVTDPAARCFHPSTIDWYHIVSQLPLPTMQYTGMKRSRVAPAAGGVAPWAVFPRGGRR